MKIFTWWLLTRFKYGISYSYYAGFFIIGSRYQIIYQEYWHSMRHPYCLRLSTSPSKMLSAYISFLLVIIWKSDLISKTWHFLIILQDMPDTSQFIIIIIKINSSQTFGIFRIFLYALHFLGYDLFSISMLRVIKHIY